MSVVLALLFFALPVGVGFALQRPGRPAVDTRPVDYDAPLPADGVVTFSQLRGHNGRYQRCVDRRVQVRDGELTPERRRLIVEELTIESHEETSDVACAERFLIAGLPRCERRWAPRLPFERHRDETDEEPFEIEVEEVTYVVEPDSEDRRRCSGEAARWVEGDS